MRSAMKPEATRLTTPKAEHQRQHLGAARRRRSRGRRNRRRYEPAASTSPRSRRRRRCTAAPAASAARTASRPAGARAPRCRRRCADARCRRRNSRTSGSMVTMQKQADADMRRAPAVGGDEMLHHRRPDRAGEIIAGGGDGDGDAAAAHEPVRDVGHQRRRSVAEQPRPISKPCASATCHRLSAIADRDIAERRATACRAPAAPRCRSGRRAVPSPRRRRQSRSWPACRAARHRRGATPKSAWMAGSATTTDHMPTPPMVRSSTATPKPQPGSAESIGVWLARRGV